MDGAPERGGVRPHGSLQASGHLPLLPPGPGLVAQVGQEGCGGTGAGGVAAILWR